MRKIIFLLVMAVLSGCGLELPERSESRTISVQGNGAIAMVPDLAVVRLGVDVQAETSQDALRTNSEKTDAIIAAVKALGVMDKDIRTASLQLHPRYEHLRDPQGRSSQHLVGYRASNVVNVRLADLATAGDTIDAASQAGANRIDSISFEISDPAQALAEARDAAWADALQQAQQLAELAGEKLDSVMSVATYHNQPVEVREMSLARAAMDSVPIAGGQQTISVRLDVTWSLVTE